jgi:hypothetical protein
VGKDRARCGIVTASQVKTTAGLSTNSVKFQVKLENGSPRIEIVIADEGGSGGETI